MPLQRCDHARREQRSVSTVPIWQDYQEQDSLSGIPSDAKRGRDKLCALPERSNVWAFLARQRYDRRVTDNHNVFSSWKC